MTDRSTTDVDPTPVRVGRTVTGDGQPTRATRSTSTGTDSRPVFAGRRSEPVARPAGETRRIRVSLATPRRSPTRSRTATSGDGGKRGFRPSRNRIRLQTYDRKRKPATGAADRAVSSRPWIRTAFHLLPVDRRPSLPLNTIAIQLNELTVNHVAYPILHYFYTRRSEYAVVVGVVVLDETLTLLRFGVPEGTRTNGATIRNTHAGVENHLETVDGTFAPADEAPPAPDPTPSARWVSRRSPRGVRRRRRRGERPTAAATRPGRG